MTIAHVSDTARWVAVYRGVATAWAMIVRTAVMDESLQSALEDGRRPA